ncbi:39263_t:CDS:2 [Gigaspora margarita]|uniref:39263_t:CDS:1 n=1 Tax=Gigaspora margarita TaxID=4874 RepID=A0ABN7VDF3_GIGMA|nr:39263_t:CDS:2 [Gigaspora margarita]
MARTILNNYLLSRQTNLIATKVAVASVLRTNTQKYPDGYYCLISVKYTRQFASMFADMSIIIFQDDKAKVGLGVLAVD